MKFFLKHDLMYIHSSYNNWKISACRPTLYVGVLNLTSIWMIMNKDRQIFGSILFSQSGIQIAMLMFPTFFVFQIPNNYSVLYFIVLAIFFFPHSPLPSFFLLLVSAQDWLQRDFKPFQPAPPLFLGFGFSSSFMYHRHSVCSRCPSLFLQLKTFDFKCFLVFYWSMYLEP